MTTKRVRGRPTTLAEDPYLACRRGARGHLWDTLPLGRRTQWGQPEDSRCTDCRSERHRTIDSMGNISVQTYEHPDDYTLDFPYTTADVRLAYHERLRKERRHLRSVC